MVPITLFFLLSLGCIPPPPALLGSYYITADKCDFFFGGLAVNNKIFKVCCHSDILHTYTHLKLPSISLVSRFLAAADSHVSEIVRAFTIRASDEVGL